MPARKPRSSWRDRGAKPRGKNHPSERRDESRSRLSDEERQRLRREAAGGDDAAAERLTEDAKN